MVKRSYEERLPIVVGALSVGLFALLWEATGQFKLVDPLFTSYPSNVLEAGFRMFVTGEIYSHIFLSAQELAIGFAIASGSGILMGLAMGRILWFREVATPFVDALYATPVIVFLPLFVFWFGIGIWTKILLIISGALVPILINTLEGVRNVEPSWVEAARSYGAKERDVFFKVILFGSIPFIISGLRLGIGRALISMLVAEFFISTGGLGYLLAVAGTTYQTAKVFALALLVALIGVLSSEALLRYERRIAPWLHTRQVE